MLNAFFSYIVAVGFIGGGHRENYLFCLELLASNFIVLGLTRSGLEPTVYHTRGEHV
jgi:hypothetical protein